MQKNQIDAAVVSACGFCEDVPAGVQLESEPS
jgi:hypothetical protein